MYEALGIPELWRYDSGRLRIGVLREGKYVQVKESPNFPGWPLADAANQYVRRAREVGRGQARREFQQWVRSRLANS